MYELTSLEQGERVAAWLNMSQNAAFIAAYLTMTFRATLVT